MTTHANEELRAGEAIIRIFRELDPGFAPVSVANVVGSVRALCPGLALTDDELFEMVAKHGIETSRNLHFDRKRSAPVAR